MWWEIAPAVRADFEDWHAHEHFPERLALPGFRRGSRWSSSDGGDGVFVLYELERHETLSSAEYLARLNAPTPWSVRLMPHHRAMVRSQCRVIASHGGAIARHAMTVRFSPRDEAADALSASLATLAASAARRPGLFGAHLLRHEAPRIGATREQALRSHADGSADWVFLAIGCELDALHELAESALAPEVLAQHGAGSGAIAGVYTLACSAVAAELA